MHQEKGVLRKTHPHPLRFLSFYLGGLLLLVLGAFFFYPAIFVGLFIILLGELVRRAETFYITEVGVTHEYKFLSTFRKSAEYRRIQNVEVRQSIIENMFGIGNVHFDTAGSDLAEVNFRGVGDPHRIEKMVREKVAASA